LLARYLARKDEGAFAVLVHRHGPLVFNVCRRVLGDIHDAEDAFQATFLVLARKAATVHPRQALSAWLHGVARRVALKARSARFRRRREGRPLLATPPDPRPGPLAELAVSELLGIVDEELKRLPEVYRLPVILCCLEGRSLEEAARQLGWTSGSVRARLERGRARLHDRLLRRGLTLSASLVAAEASRGAASADVVAKLLTPTISGAVAFASGQAATANGISAEAAALAGQLLKGMTLAKLKNALVLLLAMCLTAMGFLIHRVAYSPSTMAPQVQSSPFPFKGPMAQGAPATLAKNQPMRLDEANASIEVSGSVFDPSGRPFSGARLYVGYSGRSDMRYRRLEKIAYPLRAISKANGRFHFAFSHSELDARWLDDSRATVIAIADGYGPDWAEIPAVARPPDPVKAEVAELNLKLVEDLPVNGCILDQSRKPVATAKVLVREVSDARHPRCWRGPFPEQLTATTDAQGRFRLTGLGRDRIVSLSLDGPAIQHTSLTAAIRPSTEIPNSWGDHAATFEYKALPSQSIRGIVRDKGTGRPVAGVRMCALQHHPPTFTDEHGRFEILGCPKLPDGYAVMAQPETGQPYFAAKASVPDRPGFDPLTVDVELQGGIPLAGRVIDQATGKPLRAGMVEYYPLCPNPHAAKLTHCSALAASSALIGPDGSYGLVVLPGPGVVCVAASPRNSFAVAVVDDKEVADFFHDEVNHDGNQCLQIDLGKGARSNLNVTKYNALSLINPDKRAESLALDLTLQPGRTLQGTVIGPDGMPLTGVEVVGLTAVSDEELLEGESFTVRGLNSRCGRELLFRHRGKRFGTLLTIRGDEREPLTVRLEPCGDVLGRLVDKKGKAVPGVFLSFSRRGHSPEVTAETDRDGGFHLALVPGQPYSLQYCSRPLQRDVGQVEVESGRSADLGDLTVGD
jgi:RNA polymerase sigma factor (sigma-70 family)